MHIKCIAAPTLTPFSKIAFLSEDLSQDILNMLLALMLAQAQECNWHYYFLQDSEEKSEMGWCSDYKEAAAVAEMYAAAAVQLKANAQKGNFLN